MSTSNDLQPLVDAALTTLTGVDEPRTERAVKAALDRLAADSYRAGLIAAVTSLLTTDQVAEQLGVDSSRIRRLAPSRSVGIRIGRGWLFTPGDVEVLKERKVGRPVKTHLAWSNVLYRLVIVRHLPSSPWTRTALAISLSEAGDPTDRERELVDTIFANGWAVERADGGVTITDGGEAWLAANPMLTGYRRA